MLDRIRSLARGEVTSEYVENFEKDFDQECAIFLGVSYELVVEYVNEGLSDHAILQSCSGRGVNDNHTKAVRIHGRVAMPAREWPCGQDTDNADLLNG